ncbi:unnamed protein product [Urochloa humidicola]
MGEPKVSVSQPWADFFTAMMLNPGNFMWAKNFLSSSAWDCLNDKGQPSVLFKLPEKCPADLNSACINEVPFSKTDGRSMEEDSVSGKGKEIVQDSEPLSPCTPPEDRGVHISPSTGPWSRALLEQALQGKKQQVVVDTDLRRSDRQRRQFKGFKHSNCLDKDCLGCNSKPPTISPSLIKNLGASFCKVDQAKLTIDALAKKKKTVAPGGNKTTVKRPSKKNDDDEEPKTKKTSKKPPKK